MRAAAFVGLLLAALAIAGPTHLAIGLGCLVLGAAVGTLLAVVRGSRGRRRAAKD